MNATQTQVRFIEMGGRVQTGRLLEAGDAAVQRATEDAAELGAYFAAEKRAVLSDLVGQVRGLHSDRSGARVDLTRSTEAVKQRLSEVRAVIRKVQIAALNAFESVDEQVVGGFEAGPKRLETVPAVDVKVATLLPLCQAHAVELAAWGAPDAFAELSAAGLALSEANAGQQMEIDQLPDKTAALYEAKGRLLAMIRKLNRTARYVFRSRPTRRRGYTLWLVRGPASSTTAANGSNGSNGHQALALPPSPSQQTPDERGSISGDGLGARYALGFERARR